MTEAKRYYPKTASTNEFEDFKKRKAISSVLAKKHFAEPWQFRCVVEGFDFDGGEMFRQKQDGYHNLFDYLVKDVSFGPVEISGDPVEAGGTVFTFPKSSQPVIVSMTVRDTADRYMYQWFDLWSKEVVNPNGTFNLPSEYVRTLRIYTYAGDQSVYEQELWSSQVYPQKMGDIQMSVDGEGFTEFPITFQQFRSMGVIPTGQGA